MTPSTTGSETLAANNANNEQLPMTGGVALWPFGVFAVVFGAVVVASTRKKNVR